MKRRGGIVINDVSGRCRSVMDGVNLNMKSRTGPEDSVADTGAKTTDEESEIEETTCSPHSDSRIYTLKGWLAIAKLKPLSLFISPF